jgi:hypothetical protein
MEVQCFSFEVETDLNNISINITNINSLTND